VTEVTTVAKKIVGSKSGSKVHAQVNVDSNVGSDATTVANGSEVAATKEVKASAATPVVTKASPLADRVTYAVALLQEASDVLALTAPALTAAQRKGMGKLRKGGEKFIPEIAQIAQTWNVQIRTQPTAAMTSAIQLATTLTPLIGLMVGFLREVQDVGFEAESESWLTATALYSVLKRMSKKDPKLKAQLAPMAEFFAYRHPVVAKAAAEKKPGKESRRKAKVVAQAETLVAEESAATTAAATPATSTNGVAVTPVAHS
jgi:hypothetical protein